jgi:hypothetical protein
VADINAPGMSVLPAAGLAPTADLIMVWDASAGTLTQMTVTDLLYRHQGWVSLTDAATIVSDAAFSHNIRFQTTLGGNRTLATPTNPIDGGIATFLLKQDGTGGRTITLASGFVVPADIMVVLSTAPNISDFLTAVYHANTSKWVVLALTKGASF